MRKVILKNVNKDELRDDLAKKIEKESNKSADKSINYSQPQTYQQPQTYNPFNQDIKYEFMLFAISPIAGAIYQIFKFFNWILYTIGYGIGKFIGARRTRKSERVI